MSAVKTMGDVHFNLNVLLESIQIPGDIIWNQYLHGSDPAHTYA